MVDASRAQRLPAAGYSSACRRGADLIRAGRGAGRQRGLPGKFRIWPSAVRSARTTSEISWGALQIGGERALHRRRHRHFVAIVRVIHANGEQGSGAQARDHLCRELETQEVNGGSLLLVLALEVLISDREHSLVAGRLYPAAILDALELGERARPLGRVEQIGRAW